MNYNEESLRLHEEKQGKITLALTVPIHTKQDLSIAYTPGIAAVSKHVAQHPEALRTHTFVGRSVGVISNGTAVLGLGNIGAAGAYPVMEGKAALFKRFGNVDALPVVLEETDPEKLVELIEALAINYSGINLEDIRAPDCFYIEEELKKKLSIPVFHDDQHGTAVVVSAALKNSLRLLGKQLSEIKIVLSGAGSAGIAIAKLLRAQGAKKLYVLDSKGLITQKREVNTYKKAFAVDEPAQTLQEVIVGADVFIGVSQPHILRKEDVEKMKEPIIFALSNPVAEIEPEEARAGGAKIIATGRSDHPNQINNLLVFPGLFRGLLDANITDISQELLIEIADALANYQEANAEAIIPSALDEKVHEVVAQTVREYQSK